MTGDSGLVKLFLTLARLDGRSGKEKPVADYVVRFLRGLGLSAGADGTAARTGSNTGNVIARYRGGGDFALLAHMDTARSTKDTRAVVSARRIASDGKGQLGADDRVGIAAILYAVETAKRERLAVRPFTLAFTVMEETTMGGSINLRLGRKIRAGFLFDSSLDPGCFAVRSPGAVSYVAQVVGKASHAGIAPEKGISAIAIAAKAVASLKLGRLDRETTANVGTIQGGEATNVVPPAARVEGEVRSMDPAKVLAEVERVRGRFAAAARAAGGKVRFDSHWEFKPYRLSEDSSVYQAASAAILKAGLKPRPVPSHGGSDANNLNAAGVPALNFGTGARNPHSNEEYVLREHLRQASDIALALLQA